MNVKFQVTEKSTNPREQPGKHVMKRVKHVTCFYPPSLLFRCAYSEDQSGMKYNLCWDAESHKFPKSMKQTEHFGFHFAVLFSST